MTVSIIIRSSSRGRVGSDTGGFVAGGNAFVNAVFRFLDQHHIATYFRLEPIIREGCLDTNSSQVDGVGCGVAS